MNDPAHVFLENDIHADNMSSTSRPAVAVIQIVVFVGLAVRRPIVVTVRLNGWRGRGDNAIRSCLPNNDSGNLIHTFQTLPLLASNTDLRPVVSSLCV